MNAHSSAVSPAGGLGMIAHDSAADVVDLMDLTKSYGERKVLDRISLRIRPGEFVAVLGPSGTGKSTLLRIAAGLDRDFEGSVRIPGSIAVGFQESRLLPWKKVWQNVALGLRDANAKQRALDALAEVGLAERSDAWPVTLSGGEAQRAALARCLVREPTLLVLDEPFGALDALTRVKMHGLLLRLIRVHRPAVLLVTHDVDEAVALADRILVLDGGGVVAEVPVELGHPRARNAQEHVRIRDLLLRELGVTEEA